MRISSREVLAAIFGGLFAAAMLSGLLEVRRFSTGSISKVERVDDDRWKRDLKP